MNLKSKIISIVSALSVLATMSFAITANAEGESFTAKVTNFADNKITVSYMVENIAAITEFQVDAEFDADAVNDTPVVTYKMGGLTNDNVYDGNKLSIGAMGITSAIPADGVIATVEYTLKADLASQVDFGLVYVHLGDNDGNSFYYDAADAGNANIAIKAASAYPSVAVTDITAADPVYTGKNVNLTAVVDAEKLGDRVIEWDAVNGDVTPNPADSTKAVLVPAADGKVTVIAKVDNNGTVAEYSKDFTATTKADPLPYTISATAVSANGETTITVKPDAEYTYGEDETAPDYVLVAQFYADGKEAASWVKIEADALTSGEAKFTVGAQAAKTVSVTAYALDTEGNPTDTIVGQN